MAALWLAAGVLVCGSSLAAEELLVASRNNQKMLRYDAAHGSFVAARVEPVTEGFQTPADIALRPGEGALYVSSAGSGEIWRYTTATGQAEPPPEAGGLIQPAGIGLDAAGAYLYFAAPADGLSITRDAVKRLELASGAISTLAADASADFANVAVQGSDVYAVDALGGVERRARGRPARRGRAPAGGRRVEWALCRPSCVRPAGWAGGVPLQLERDPGNPGAQGSQRVRMKLKRLSRRDVL